MTRIAAMLVIGALALSATALAQAQAQAVRMKDLLAAQPAPREQAYKTVGERKLRLFIFDPPGHRADAKVPAVVFIHGGGWGGGKPDLFFPHCRYFAARGAVAMSIEYRLTSPKGTTIFECVTDAKSAIRAIRAGAAELGIDPNRIAVIGDSSGGHLAACTGIVPDLDEEKEDPAISSAANAMVLYNAILDMTDLPWVRNVPGIKGATSQPGSEPADRRVSPIHHVRPGLPPALVLQGTADVTVPYQQAERFTAAMKQAGNRCDLILYKDVKHAFVLPGYGKEEILIQSIRAADAFLASLGYLTGEPTLE